MLDVVAVYFNPMRWNSRLRLFREFSQHMHESGVRLTVVECAHRDLPFDLQEDGRCNLVRVRSDSTLWLKECLLNIGISRLPDGWQYVCCADADIKFRDPHWAERIVDSLQHYQVVQPWAHCYDLGPNGEHLGVHHSFGKQYWKGDYRGLGKGSEGVIFGHPGFVWAFRRTALNRLSGLIETGIAGAGDHHMALALIGNAAQSLPKGVSDGYA